MSPAAQDLQNGTILVVVPSHTASESNDGRPLARVAALLAKDSDRYIPMVDSLIRTKTVQEKKSGGARSIDVDLDSMRVANPSALKNRTIVVLDDVSTSGGTLSAARQLIRRAGAKRVAAVALGGTVKDY